MKKSVAIVGMACLLLALPLAIGKTGKEPLKTWERRITFISPYSDNAYWEKICVGAMEEGKLRGMDVKCVSSADNDEAKVIDNLESAVWSDVDGIIAYGVNNSAEFLDVLGQARQQKIPVVLVDSNVNTDRKLCYVGTDNYQSGWTAGEKMAQDCAEQGSILVVVSSREADNQQERVAGFSDALKQYPDMEIWEILEGSSNMMQGKKRMEDALARNPQIAGIFCAEGITSYGALSIMMERSSRIEPIPVTVYEYGALIGEGLKEGYISTAIVQDPGQMGQVAVRVLDEYLEKGIVPSEDIYTEMKLIRKDNLKEGEALMKWSGEVEWHYY